MGDRHLTPSGLGWRGVAVNTLSGHGRELIDIAIFLIVTPFVIRTLGLESFGLWALIWSVMSVITLADLGLRSAATRFVAESRGRQDQARLEGVVATVFWCYCALAALVLCVTWGVAECFGLVFSLTSEQSAVAPRVLLILGSYVACSLPLGVFHAVLAGFQKTSLIERCAGLSSVLYGALVLFFLSRYPRLETLAILNACVTVVPTLMMVGHSRRFLPLRILSPRYCNLDLLREVTHFSKYFLVGNISSLVYSRVDNIVITRALGFEWVGIYSVAMRLSEQARQMCVLLSQALSPVWAELFGAGDDERIPSLLLTSSKISIAFATPLLFGMAYLASPLVVAFAGEEFRAAGPVLSLLAVAAWVRVVISNPKNLLAMVGHQRFVAVSNLFAQGTNVALSLAVVGPYGVLGVAAVSLLIQVPLAFAIQRRVREVYSFPLLRFAKLSVLPSVVCGFAMLMGLEAVSTWIPIDNLIEVAVAEVLGLVLFASVFWTVGLSSEERSRVHDQVRAQLGRLARG